MALTPIVVPIHATSRCTLRHVSGWVHTRNIIVGGGAARPEWYWHTAYVPGTPLGYVPVPAWPGVGGSMKCMRYATSSAWGHIDDSGPHEGELLLDPVGDEPPYHPKPTPWSDYDWCYGFAFGKDGQRRFDVPARPSMRSLLDMWKFATGDLYRLLVVDTANWTSTRGRAGECMFAEATVRLDTTGDATGYQACLDYIATNY